MQILLESGGSTVKLRPVRLQCREQGKVQLEVSWRDGLEMDLRGPVCHTGSLNFIQNATKANEGFLTGMEEDII